MRVGNLKKKFKFLKIQKIKFFSKLKLPYSEYCAESFLEVRESNSSGKIVTRACSFEDVIPTMVVS